MEKVRLKIESGTLLLDVAQNAAYDDLQLYFESDQQMAYKLHKAILTVNEDLINYRFSMDLKSLLAELTRDDNTTKRLVLMHQYIRKANESDDQREYDRLLKLPLKREWSVSGANQVWDDARQHYLQPYLTKNNGIALLVDHDLKPGQYKNFQVMQKIRVVEQQVSMQGYFDTLFFELRDCHLELVDRGGDQVFKHALPIHEVETKYARIHRYVYDVTLTMAEMAAYLKNLDQSNELSLDLFVVGRLTGTDVPLKFRLGRPRFMTNYRLKGELALKDDQRQQWLSLVPYFTIKGYNLSFTFNAYEAAAYDYFRAHRGKWQGVIKAAAKRDIWVIGERSYKAQDNGFRFFKYLREQHPEVEAYYVIRKDAVERQNVAPLGHVLTFGSAEHFEKVIQAKYICGTHHPDFLYPIRSKGYVDNIQAKRIFLQHGVFGTKNIKPFYGKQVVNGFYTDLFITSSQKEKRIAMTDLGYDDREVAVTGLARFDSLFKHDLPLKRQLLIIPTWRDWLTNDEIFEQSEYLQRYWDLLFDPRLKQFADRYGMRLIFCLHPNMQAYVDYFKDAPVTIVRQGEVDVQMLIKESMMMLTDYSSVAFDFSFLHRPVLYYTFDRQRFLGRYPSHLNLDEELPGPMVTTLDEIFDQLDAYGQQNFAMRPADVKRADRFIAHRDTHSCDRIFSAITHLADKTAVEKVRSNPIYGKVKRRIRRKRKVYFPMMKTLYWFWSHFTPIKKNQILFESSVGKRYEDSPRAIYEQMVKTHPELDYVWVSRTNQPLQANPKTRIVKRLSFEYYRALATSRYWVNNQNFPTYLTKRRGTGYLQTWHGTPLKKMQHDQQVIEGRKPGYLKRVTHAKNQWSALVSPSPYATKAFRSAFQYRGPVIEAGYPRNDIFYAADVDQVRQRVRQELGITPDQRVILYAPTFRDYEKSHGRFVLDNQLDFEQFESQLGDDYVLLMREHVVVASKLRIPEAMRHNVINVSNYPNVQELMVASDALVTDYSSIMFDYLNTDKPLYFFCYDLEKYLELRGVYFDFTKEVPGPIVKDAPALFTAIGKGDASYWQTYGTKYQSFKQKFVPNDGPDTATKVYQQFLDRY